MITIAGVEYGVMFDSINPAALPAGGDAYLGYVDGRWPDYVAIAAAHNVPCYGLDVNGSKQGDGEDTEPGNIGIDGAAGMLAAEKAAGVDRPIGYCPESEAKQLCDAAGAHGMSGAYTRAGRAGSWRLLTAHYAGYRHICGPATCGCPVEADGTQWASYPTYDESILDPSFLQAASHPGPAGAPADPSKSIRGKEEDMVIISIASGAAWFVFGDKVVGITNAADGEALKAAGVGEARISDDFAARIRADQPGPWSGA